MSGGNGAPHGSGAADKSEKKPFFKSGFYDSSDVARAAETAYDDAMDEAELKLMEEQLTTFRTLEGKPYRLLKLPMPRAIYDGEDRLPATYANFLVVNGAVLCPTYAQPDLDAEALRLIGEAFPEREIVGIDCRSIIKQHGSLHCCTMQFPTITNRQ